MDDEYDILLASKKKLTFKGDKKKKKAKNHRSSEAGSASSNQPKDARQIDADSHDGWWTITKSEDIHEDIVIEFLPGRYAKALDNGNIALGDQHEPGEGPEEEEIFTAIRAPSNQFALKSGFGRYLSIDSNRRLVGLSEAIGERELFLASIEDSKMAICGFNDRFLRADLEAEGKPIVAWAEKVGSPELVTIRTNQQIKTAII